MTVVITNPQIRENKVAVVELKFFIPTLASTLLVPHNHDVSIASPIPNVMSDYMSDY